MRPSSVSGTKSDSSLDYTLSLKRLWKLNTNETIVVPIFQYILYFTI